MGDIVCENVPVVTLDKGSPFEENCSWMLQSACERDSKADKCYQWLDDDEIFAACRRLGLGKDDIMPVTVVGHPNVRAVGTSGKRSVMMACCIALSMSDPEGLDGLWKMLKDYKLHKEYWDILELVGANSKEVAAPQPQKKQFGFARKAQDQDS